MNILKRNFDANFNTDVYRPNGIIQSMLDVDAYVLSMQQVAHEKYPNAQVRYKLVVRSDDNLMEYAGEIREEIYSLENLYYKDDELDFLYSEMTWLKPMFLEYLRHFKLDPRKSVKFSVNDAGDLEIEIVGLWASTIPFEIMILSILAEIRNRKEFPDLKLETFRKNMQESIDYTKQQIANRGLHHFKLMEFGTRRRASFNVQKVCLEMLSKQLPEHFVGTSNLHLAKELNLPFQGTMAHQYMAAHQVLAPLPTHQKVAMEVWDEVFQGRLGVFLPDTISSDAFLKDFDYKMAKNSLGVRQDSGSPSVFADKFIAHYKSLGIDPKTKRIIFSDNLNMDKGLDLTEKYQDQTMPFVAMGTYLNNMFYGVVGNKGREFKALSAVIKLVEVNGFPVVKISDDEGKEISECPIFLAHIKKQFLGK